MHDWLDAVTYLQLFLVRKMPCWAFSRMCTLQRDSTGLILGYFMPNMFWPDAHCGLHTFILSNTFVLVLFFARC